MAVVGIPAASRPATTISFILRGLLAITYASCPVPVLAYAPLSDASLRSIPSGGTDLDADTGALLAPLLIPRVPGTPGSQAAQAHLAGFFRDHLPGWTAEWHNTTAMTPDGSDGSAAAVVEVPFVNLILRRDPPWARPGDVARLTLAAHYDSLRAPAGFVGATDSAAPCALLLQVARGVDTALARKWDAMAAAGDAGLVDDVGVQILFLDGEEAWFTWSATDSLYGSRALAESWETTTYDAGSIHRGPLDAISLFVLLDLLGAPDPRVPSYFHTTHWAYEHLAAIERRMRGLGLLESAAPFLPDADDDDDAGKKKKKQFRRGSFVEDDHVPFLVRGVDILHLIPTPFPPTWHTMDDDGAHLDAPTLRDWARIVTAFVAEWLELDGLLPPLPEEDHGGETVRRKYSDKSEL